MKIIKVSMEEVGLVTPLFDMYRVFYGQESDIKLAASFIEERIINNDSIIFLVKDDQGLSIGFTQLYPCFSSVSAKRTWILNDLFVVPKSRGLGVGKLLLNTAKEFAKSTHSKGIALETAHDNVGAQKLYESLGYKRDSGFYSYYLSLNTEQ
ncbi:GNAT family N-acetyltransferase [Vibrio rumoiensis]|uniref:GNAT family N-acetyltransferase n=1 Tax=Vibrio rumoiensis 1S-45 TaxID=1188252 RepID=A0A1E5E116_9VIBR|nr:GNAT family N-acetyltransferase [Vibrio rumoiensis]OEF24134.1 GNAT family N-acetyltransferase [Vibrio rumoiensis 1S-45]